MPTIKVRARGTALVPDYKQLFNGVKRFVGWKFDPELGELVEILDETGKPKKVRQTGWRKLDEDVELDVSDLEIALEYKRALAFGDLFAADQATADFANAGNYAERIGSKVVFDSAFTDASPSDGAKPKEKKKA